jgi:hypothetical protein
VSSKVRHRFERSWIAAWALALLACGPDDRAGVRGVPGFGADAREGDDAGPGHAPEPLAYAVVASDRTATTIALLDPDGTMLARDFVHSGSAPAGLVTALSGDVALPTQSGERTHLVLLDRFRTDVITRIDVASGDVLAQVGTHAARSERTGGAYSSNPQDYVYIGPHEAWVSRYNPNLTVAVSDLDAGNDLIAIDVAAGVRSDRRIDLSALDTVAERGNPDTGETERVTAYARPGRIVRLGEFLVVGLSRLSRGFDAVGEGMIALVHPERGDVQGVALPGLRNCAQVVPVPGDPERVAVACAGLLRGTFGAGAGLALVALADETLEVEHLLRFDEDSSAAVAVFGLVAVGGNAVVAVEPGHAPGQRSDSAVHGDRLYRIDVASGDQRLLFEADASFVLGDGAFNSHRGTLLVPDGSTDDDGRASAGVRRFAIDGDDITELDVVAIDDVLPPWQVAPL